MSETAESVADDVATSRNITIEINNLTKTYCLLNPTVFLESGETFNPPQPTVHPQKAEVCSFSKHRGQAKGSVGVMTYDLFNISSKSFVETMAIMWSVPFNYNRYKNWFAVGFYPKDHACDEALYKEMYYNSETSFKREEANGSGITYEGDNLDIHATMSPMGTAIMKVELWDRLSVPGFSGQVALSQQTQ